MKLEERLKRIPNETEARPLFEKMIEEFYDLPDSEKKIKNLVMCRQRNLAFATNVAKVLLVYEGMESGKFLVDMVHEDNKKNDVSYMSKFDIYLNKEVFEAISKLDNVNGYELVIKTMRYGKGIEFARDIVDERIVDGLKRFAHYEKNCAIIHAVNNFLEDGVRTIDVIDKYEGLEETKTIVRLIWRGAMKKDGSYPKLLDIMEEYIDNYTEIGNYLEGLHMDSVDPDYDELLREETMNKIRENPNFLYKLSANYSDIRSRVDLDLSHKEIDLIVNAYKLVETIHSSRQDKDKEKIKDEFYVELNRAISQSDNVKQKMRLLKQYCKEVTEQIKNNAEELMYET